MARRVVKLKPVFGYLHRNHEKIAESTTYLGSMPYTDRLDYFCSLTNNWAYALAVEKLAGLQVPERAEYIRVITAELTRLQNHACLMRFLLQDMGASGTPLMYAFREREKILDLFEALTGARMMCNYMRFGGCRCDLPAGLAGAGADGWWTNFPRFLDEFETLLNENEILMARTQGVGVLPRELAVNASITGPMLRATGVNYDIRKVDQYGIYDRFEFRVPLGEHGDVYDRYMMRVLEMRESVKILQQALRDIPAGPDHRSEGEAARLPAQSRRGLRPHRSAERRTRLLSISDGSPNPYRYRVRPPSFINLTSRRHVPRPDSGGRGHHSRQRGHRAWGGGPMKLESCKFRSVTSATNVERVARICEFGIAARIELELYYVWRRHHQRHGGDRQEFPRQLRRSKSGWRPCSIPEERLPRRRRRGNFPFLVYDGDDWQKGLALRGVPDLREGMPAQVHLHRKEQGQEARLHRQAAVSSGGVRHRSLGLHELPDLRRSLPVRRDQDGHGV